MPTIRTVKCSANEERFSFFKAEHMPDLPGYAYAGSVIFGADRHSHHFQNKQ